MGVVKTQVRDLSLEGQSIENASTVQRSRLGLILIPEDRRVFPDLTVEQNILLGAKAAKKVRSPIGIRKIYRCIPTLERLKDRYGSNLSGGEQQMVAIARGVMGAPRLLLLDEPLEGLAPLIAREIVAFLKILTVEAQFGFIIAEQSINLVRQCTNRVLVLSRGVIVFDGSWSDFDRNPTLINTHLAV
jgi:branched-chain amino acid transport system ATP-binding protein